MGLRSPVYGCFDLLFYSCSILPLKLPYGADLNLQCAVSHGRLSNYFNYRLGFYFRISAFPRFSNAAHWTVPSSSEMENIVGPPVCFIWITSPERWISFPMYFVSSMVFLLGSCFSICITWKSFGVRIRSSMLPFGAMFFTSTKILSPSSGVEFRLLEWISPRICVLRSCLLYTSPS